MVPERIWRSLLTLHGSFLSPTHPSALYLFTFSTFSPITVGSSHRDFHNSSYGESEEKGFYTRVSTEIDEKRYDGFSERRKRLRKIDKCVLSREGEQKE